MGAGGGGCNSDSRPAPRPVSWPLKIARVFQATVLPGVCLLVQPLAWFLEGGEGEAE